MVELESAVVLMLACVGLAWSQTPAPTPVAGTGERFITLHEDGKGLRCRVIANWPLENGAKAYQLQAVESGESITIVEEGPGTTMQEPLLGGKLQSQPMRIFHWGTSKTPPPGVPAAPISPATAPADVSGRPAIINQTIRRDAVTTRPVVVERDAPIVVSSTQPVAVKASTPTVVSTTTPATAWPSESVVIETMEKPPEKSPRLFSRLFSSNKAASQPEVTIIKTDPAPYIPSAPAPLPNKSAFAYSTQAMPSRAPATIAQSAYATPVYTNATAANPMLASNSTTAPLHTTENHIQPVVMVTQSTAAAPLPSANAGVILASDNQPVPEAGQGPTPVVNYAAFPAQTSAPTTPATTIGESTIISSSDVPAKSARPTVFEKMQNFFHPRRETATVRPAETTVFTGPSASVATTGATYYDRPAANAVPFSTAAGLAIKDTTPAPSAPAGEVLAAAGPIETATNPNIGPPVPGSAPVSGTISEPAPKKTWRTMWGQSKEAKVQVPGLSMVDQASAKPNPNIPLLNNTTGLPTVAGDQSADILLSPEKFDPSGLRQTPKGINMNAFRGDPTQLMSKPAAPVMAKAAPVQEQAPPMPQFGMPPPLPPGQDGQTPPGTQSVLAAGANIPSPTPFVPAPLGMIPEPTRPSLPPAPRLPEPPPPANYVNAFTPPAPPPAMQPVNPMTMNAFSNIASPANMSPPPLPGQVAQILSFRQRHLPCHPPTCPTRWHRVIPWRRAIRPIPT